MGQIKLRNVVKEYDSGVRVLNGLNLDIRNGEFVVLVGPSGCGKSTILRIIAGLETLSSGEVELDGQVLNQVPPGKRDIAMVFQSYALYPHMTVSQNIEFGMKIRNTHKAERKSRVLEAARMLGLEGMLERKPKQLSGGQRQRVALGRAIVRDPKCFLFDEPLSNLDAKLRVQMRTEIKQLHSRLRSTCIYVTHDQEEAMTLGQKVGVIRGGEIQQFDTPLKVYNHPANQFVASFLGSPPMNFFEGRIAASEGRLWFATDCGRFAVPESAVGELSQMDGQSVTVGLRPQDVQIAPATDSASGIRACVRSVEELGDRNTIYLDSGVTGCVAVQSRPFPAPREKETVMISCKPEQLHFFEAGGQGLNLVRSTAPEFV
jgi:multiple sugar transport system ATP-binding protein